MQDDRSWLTKCSRRGWAWEFLRRQPYYQEAYKQHGPAVADAGRWGLMRYEDPMRDARAAAIFWRKEDCPSVLPLIAIEGAKANGSIPFSLDQLSCRVDWHQSQNGESSDLLFSDAGKYLQVSVEPAGDLKGAHLFTPALNVPDNLAARIFSLRRFNDLIQHGHLRPNLYPPEPRASRLLNVLKALEGAMAGLSHREIALLIFSRERVESDWGGRQHHLRDQVRRAVAYGHVLMNGGYRQFLGPTSSRRAARQHLASMG